MKDSETALEGWSADGDIPTVLVALDGGQLLGSVNVLRSEMTVRPAFTPWLAQLFVAPGVRRGGVGAALVTAAIDHARVCGFSTLYLMPPAPCRAITPGSAGTRWSAWSISARAAS